MYGLYQIPPRHDQFDAQLRETPASPDLFDWLGTFFRRLLRSLFH